MKAYSAKIQILEEEAFSKKDNMSMKRDKEEKTVCQVAKMSRK
jgi:hypothetical protein